MAAVGVPDIPYYSIVDNDPNQPIHITLEEYSHFYCYLAIPCIISYIVTFLLGILGNSLVIWIVGFKMRSVSAVWFLNLAITDSICNMALILRITEWSMLAHNFNPNKGLCKVSTSLMFFNMLTSVNFLTVISIDRFVSIFWPIWSKVHRTHTLAKIISVIIWWISIIITAPYVAFFNYRNLISDCNLRIINLIIKDHTYNAHALLNPKLVLLFAFPFSIIVITYGLIAFRLRKRKRPTGSQQPFKVITTVVVCFFVCWCPYSIWPLIPMRSESWMLRNIIREMCICLAYFNSCINPIIYVFSSPDFKLSFTVKSLPARLKNAFKDRDDIASADMVDGGGKTCTTSL